MMFQIPPFKTLRTVASNHHRLVVELAPVAPKAQTAMAALQIGAYSVFLVVLSPLLIAAMTSPGSGPKVSVAASVLAALWVGLFAIFLPRAHAYAGSEMIVLDSSLFQQQRRLFGIPLPARSCPTEEIVGIEVRQPGLLNRYLKPIIVIQCRRRSVRVGGGLSQEQGLALAQRLRVALSAES